MSSSQPSPAEPVGWGILSTARINAKLLPGLRAANGAVVAAVASRDASRAAAYAEDQSILPAYGSYEALLADPDVTAVYIPLPNALHIEWTRRALEAGKHVLCEKPLGRRAAEVEKAFEMAQTRGLLLMEAFMYRHHPQTARVEDLVRSGAIGRLRMIRGAFSFMARDPGDVRLQAALDGGGLMDVGCYCVNAARMLAGEPDRVTAQQTLGGDGVDVGLVATMSFPSGVLAHFDCGLAMCDRDELEVVGEDGSLFLDDPWHCRDPVIELRSPAGTERIELPRIDPYQLEIENFSAAVRGQAEPLLGRADAVGQATTIEALYAAVASGAAVTPAS